MTGIEKYTLEKFTSLLQAYVEGKEVQFRDFDTWKRGPIEELGIKSFNPSNWRVKPDAPKVQPWTFETAPDFAVKAKRKESGNQGLLVFLPNGCLFMMGSGIHDPALALQYDYKRATEELEQLDGSPCGIEQKEESEWPKWAVDCSGDIWMSDSATGPVFLYRKRDSYQKESTTWNDWSEVLKAYFQAREIPVAEAERIMSEAKEGVMR